MSILIKGIDMPKEGLYELSFAQSDGITICLIEKLDPNGGGTIIDHDGVVEVPTPHGNLIDRTNMNIKDMVSRTAVIEIFSQLWNCIEEIADKEEWEDVCKTTANELSSAEPLTDAEQRIFLKAMGREEEVCRKVDAMKWGKGDEECEINLVHTCHEIVRKVKGALWI